MTSRSDFGVQRMIPILNGTFYIIVSVLKKHSNVVQPRKRAQTGSGSHSSVGQLRKPGILWGLFLKRLDNFLGPESNSRTKIDFKGVFNTGESKTQLQRFRTFEKRTKNLKVVL